MGEHVWNFNPGPAALPRPALQQVQQELLDFEGTGISILETSHRSPIYERVHNEAIEHLRALLGLGEDHAILFMGGGARTQFGLVAMNLLRSDQWAEYVTTGRWSELALQDASTVGDAREIWSSAPFGHDRVPQQHEIRPSADAAYLHYTSNNTIFGTEFPYVPTSGDVPLVCDMTSDIFTSPLDASRFGLIYAGAQKNIGPAGLTIVIVRKDLLECSPTGLPDPLSYAKVCEKNSLLNTPPVFAVYTVALVARHIRDEGGLGETERRTREKARMVYEAIDRSEGFYLGHARTSSRSRVNATFRLANPDLEEEFLEESRSAGMIGLKGHRSVGGIRVSLYNGVPLEAVRALVTFMEEFQDRRG